MLRVDRHRLGPRVYVLGRHVHEWQVGAGILLSLAVVEVMWRDYYSRCARGRGGVVAGREGLA